MFVYDAIIIGAGASGLMCASKIKGRVLVLDKNEDIGAKILISGGGKCNFSNKNMGPSHYISSTPERIGDILNNWTVKEAIQLLNKYNVKYEEREKGKLFAFNSKDILNILKSECEKNKVKFALGVDILSVSKDGDLFTIDTGITKFISKTLVIATGGKSYPHIGASDFGLLLAKQLKFKLIQNQPALVGLKYPNNMKTFSSLSGISLPVNIKVNNKTFSDNLLFAHIGITGPAVLNISLYSNIGDVIEIDFCPDKNLIKLPKRVYNFFMNYFDISQKSQLLSKICNLKYINSGTFGYTKAEVMKGGVWLGYLNNYLGSDKIKGLYFIGEVLDITGELGGYNLHFAFASGITASLGINQKV